MRGPGGCSDVAVPALRLWVVYSIHPFVLFPSRTGK